jgi:hypothetical protein
MDLGLDGVAEGLERLRERHEPEGRHDALGEAAEEQEDRAVEPHLLQDVRPPDLDGDDLARRAPDGAMDLGHRGGGDGLRVEARVELVERPAELVLDRAAHAIERERRDLIAEPRELIDERAREEVGARRRDLAHLDERRAEPRARIDQRHAERARHPLRRRTGPPAKELAREDADAARGREQELQAPQDETAAADRRRRRGVHGGRQFERRGACGPAEKK